MLFKPNSTANWAFFLLFQKNLFQFTTIINETHKHLNTNNLQFKNTPKCNIESTEKRLKQHKLKGLSYTAKHWDLGAFIFVLSKKLINRWSHFSKRITN